MSIRIHSVSVNGLGPIALFKCQFKDVNLIFGRNEQGKTYLVEYLLRSLFRSSPKTRTITDSGQVNVSGLANENIRFDPKCRKKIEDFLFADLNDRAIDLSRLCVVKGGETSFLPNNSTPISKDVIKDYLSDQRILDAITSHISNNIQTCTWENGEIIPARQVGEWKKYASLVNDLKKADELLDQVNQTFRQGEITKEKLELDKLNLLIEEQESARKFYAYTLSEQKKAIEAELHQLPVNELEAVKHLNYQIKILRKQLEQDNNEIRRLEPQCTHYFWLETAIAECEKRPQVFIDKLGLFFVILAIFLTAAAILFAFFEIPFGSLAAGLLAIFFAILTILYYQARLKASPDIAEVDRIFTQFEAKFAIEASTISDLKTTLKTMTPLHFRLITLKDEVAQTERELAQLEEELQTKLATLANKQIHPSEADAAIAELDAKYGELSARFNQLSLELRGVGIDEEDYIFDNKFEPYEPEKLKHYESLSLKIIQSISDKERSLEILKQRLCDMTSNPISIKWNELIDSLRKHREGLSQSVKEIKAQIGSGIIVTEVINQKRAKEDENIAHALALPTLRKPLQALTHSYESVEIEGNEIIVSNGYQWFPINELSTGTQEQVLLALRIGIASYLLKDQPMFLILDDAFQHSDWQRREWLVDQMADLASIGWQIIYFSMDDHIKQLFEERIKPKLGDRFALFELNN